MLKVAVQSIEARLPFILFKRKIKPADLPSRYDSYRTRAVEEKSEFAESVNVILIK